MGGSAKTVQQPVVREAKQFWCKVWGQRDHKKSRMDKQHRKRVAKSRRKP